MVLTVPRPGQIKQVRSDGVMCVSGGSDKKTKSAIFTLIPLTRAKFHKAIGKPRSCCNRVLAE
jgi:hypothetical protein